MISCTSLLNSLLSTIIDPATCYLEYLVVPQSAYHQVGFRRAFEERLNSITDIDIGSAHGFRVQPIRTLTTDHLIPPTLTPATAKLQTSVTAQTSIIYVHGRPTEVMLGGIKMGSRFPPDVRGASYLSRARIGQDFFDIICSGRWRLHWELCRECTYRELKREAGKRTASVKLVAKEALGWWIMTDPDVEFMLVARPRLSDGL